MLKVKGLRLEKFTYEDNTGENQETDRYILYVIDERNKKYELSAWIEEGECYSGYCGASFGYLRLKDVNNFKNTTHTPIKDLVIDIKAEDISEDMDLENDIFKLYDCGDYYYPCAGFEFNMDLFKPTNRRLVNRPVWLFIGESNIGKSYLASIIAENEYKTVYETDSNEQLPNEIIADVIVKGNKYDFSIEDIKDSIFGEYELIIVNFDKYSK